MKWSELERKAVKHGFKFERHGKKHDIYYNPQTEIRIEIERHGSTEVRNGLYNDLKKKIGF